MKCPLCGAWSEVKETRGAVRRRLCANEHSFKTQEVYLITPERRTKLIADDVVLRGMMAKEVATKYQLGPSYVSRCVKQHYPGYSTRVESQRKRRLRDRQKGTP